MNKQNSSQLHRPNEVDQRPTPARKHQRVAHALLSLNTPQAANKLIQGGLYHDHGKLRARKDKKEPL